MGAAHGCIRSLRERRVLRTETKSLEVLRCFMVRFVKVYQDKDMFEQQKPVQKRKLERKFSELRMNNKNWNQK